MDVAVFSTKTYDRRFLEAANSRFGHQLSYFETRLTPATAPLAKGFGAVCTFVNDMVSRQVLATLAANGTRMLALRCAGFNNVDLAAATEFGLTVVRVPAYSPHAVAEHTVGMILCLNRKLHRAYNRVREGNFALDGLLGFDLYGRTVGIVGTGKIGQCAVQILSGFGCRVLAYDIYPQPDTVPNATYVDLAALLAESEVVSLHLPLTPQNHHLINAQTIAAMKRGVMLINTSRGGLVDTRAVIAGLKSRAIGALGLDVYEEEADLFFEDRSAEGLPDDLFARLLTFPNVLITGHQAFFTSDALGAIAETTLQNIADVEHSRTCANVVTK